LWPLLGMLLLCAGCRPDGQASSNAGPGSGGSAEAAEQWRDELFTYAVNNVNRLEEFDAGDIMPQLMRGLNNATESQAAGETKTDSLAATWPEPEMLRQVVNRLNQWTPTQEPPADWKPDPMTALLPASVRELAPVRNLDNMEFSSYDGFCLQEAVWLRELSNWARGSGQDDLQRTRNLFDWTVRNIQLDAEALDRTPQFPWETLLLGQGTALERAWVFMLLVRQQGLDAAVLAVDTSAARKQAAAVGKQAAVGKHAAEKADKVVHEEAGPATPISITDLQPWCVAVLIEGKLYLFDPALGLPIPAPGKIRRDRAGQLDLRPATLAEVIADPGLLRRLDLSPAQLYPLKAKDLRHLVLLVESSPSCLAKRMKLVESHLAGKQKMVLTTAPSEQAQRLQKAAGQGVVAQLWLFPYQTLQQRLQLSPQGIAERLMMLLPFYALPSAPLYHGRVTHLKGQFTDEQGATASYQAARPSDTEVANSEPKRAEVYFKTAVQVIESLPPAQQAAATERAKEWAGRSARVETNYYYRGKLSASYWLGVIAFERGNYASAIDYFTKRTLDVTSHSPWAQGARYNLARAYEALGQVDKAIEQYRAAEASPAQGGSLLRAQWLKGMDEGGRTKDEKKVRKEGKDGRNPKSLPLHPVGW
jgi:tetratricopeptide (TPR) repeat protein